MADGTQLKIADKNDFAEEDPFAELTRIMGFDPRQPVRQEAAALSARAEPSMDDFGIDLEKELLGELAGEDLTAVPERAVSAPYVQAEQSVAYASVDAPASYARAEPAFAAEPSFDDAMVASFEQEFSLEDELLPREASTYAEMPARAPQNTYASEPAYASAHAYAPEPAHSAVPDVDFTPEAAFDDAVEASFDQHFSIEDELLPSEHAVEPVVAQQHYAPAEPDFDADFDVALADVDMDFAAHDDAGYAAPVSVADEQFSHGGYRQAEAETTFSHQGMVEEVSVAAPVVSEQGYDEFERRLQEALVDDEPAVAPVSQLAYPPAYEPVHAPEIAPTAVAEDKSLEDELNALLGSMSSQSRAQPEPVAAPVRAIEPAAAEPAVSYSQPASWAVEAGQQTAHAREAYPGTSVGDDMASYGQEAPQVDFYAGEDASALAVQSGYGEPTYDHQADVDVSFDDDAFDLALQNSVPEQPAPVAAPTVQPAPERPLAASRYAQARSWGLGTPVAPRAAAPVADAQPIYTPDVHVPVAATYVPRSEPAAYAPPVEEERGQQAASLEDDLEAELFAAVSSFDDVPEIETVDVPEKAVALADDLDIPELSFEDETPPAAGFDDLDGEFTNLMNEMNAGDTGTQSSASHYASNPYASGFDRKTLRDGDTAPARSVDLPAAAAAGAVAGAAAMSAGRRAAPQQGYDPLGGFDLGGTPQGRSPQQAADDDFAYDPDFDEVMATTGFTSAQPEARPARRGMMIAALLAGVAVIGGVGAWALSSGGIDGVGSPVLVKADESPIKVRPENPGGVTVPNQDNKVYDRVAGSGDGAPTQQKLVTNAEEPIDVAAQEAEAAASNMPLDAEENADAPAPKSEDRVDQAMQAAQPDANTETAAVAPRKVRTMVVRPDGTLVPREEPAPVAAAEPADPAPQRADEPNTAAAGTVPVAAEKPALAPVAAAKPAPAAKPEQTASTPSSAPIAPQRPSEQPVNVVGEVKPDQVAAVAPSAPTAAASGAWAMQIASQPSEEAAKSTYADLVKRYGSVLNGREASIVKAEIAGKGTFWRVRVPAGSRNDAVALCEGYKAAGGNCFVSK